MFQKSAVLCSLITLIVLVTPLIALAQSASSTPDIATTTPPTSTPTPTLNPHNSTDVEAAVRAYFADVPVMAAIANCESTFRQYASSGAVLNGGSGGMIGVFQINKSVHAAFALSLGDDITTLAGNMAYARYLYNNEGTEPWDSSKSCWGSVTLADVASSTLSNIEAAVTPAVAKADTKAYTKSDTVALSANLKLGSINPQVATLQQMLNASGYKVAASGAGSPGHESTTFGAATEAAVERFQCAQNIVCRGTVATTGFGLVGAKTRAALMVNL